MSTKALRSIQAPNLSKAIEAAIEQNDRRLGINRSAQAAEVRDRLEARRALGMVEGGFSYRVLTDGTVQRC